VRPIRLLRAFVRKLPKLAAEESMQAAEATGMGTGSFDKKLREDVRNRWNAAAEMHRRARRRPVTADTLSTIGIGLRVRPAGTR